jgi:alkylation response protein AidB-like acyl-CoA dehydrogenase
LECNSQLIFLARQIAFLKAYCTSSGQATATDAVQIFGGRGITRTGIGRFVEHYHRTIVAEPLSTDQN